MGVHFLLCRTLCGNRKCLEISQAGLRKRRGFLPHPVFRHPPPHWEADVLFGACTRTVCSERSHQDLAYVASGYWSWYWSMRCFNHRYKESVKFSFKTIIFYFQLPFTTTLSWDTVSTTFLPHLRLSFPGKVAVLTGNYQQDFLFFKTRY